MSASPRLMPFPAEWALEDAAFGQGIAPTRLYCLLLPVWQVEIRADITEGEDFFLIDRFLGRGLRHGALHTVDELAAFFALDRALVAQAVRFLTAIGHVRQSADRLTLTPLGQRSVDDDIRYVVTRQDRRKLYFEALSGTPLTREHYDEEVVTLLSGDGLAQATRGDRHPRFTPVLGMSDFDASALDRLKHRKDRARFNLPVAMDALESLGAELVFLPVYVVRGHGGLLVYGQAGAGRAHDPELSELCTRAPELINALDNEEQAEETDERVRRAAQNWLGKQNLESVSPEQEADGTWTVSLPAAAFRGNGIPEARIGTYRVAGSGFFRVWCKEPTPRKRALLDRLDQRLGSRRHVSLPEAEELIARLCRQLDLDPPELSRLRAGAGRTGHSGLEAQLARLEDEQK
ncbi:hypothetical protein ACOBQB_12990 [Streptomyces sp. G5(2025)]|uniref:hypothetical protein n=1 Tax=Streptomyces sp. G5(2025) TaxID=3406628 RepID=UPI003C2694DA